MEEKFFLNSKWRQKIKMAAKNKKISISYELLYIISNSFFYICCLFSYQKITEEKFLLNPKWRPENQDTRINVGF